MITVETKKRSISIIEPTTHATMHIEVVQEDIERLRALPETQKFQFSSHLQKLISNFLYATSFAEDKINA
jgi:hypothetical protein